MSNDLKQISSPYDQGFSRQGPESPGGVKERALVLVRPNSRLVGSVFVDEGAAVISQGLVETVRHKAFLLISSILLEPQFGVRERVKLRGQVGLIRLDRLPNSPNQKRAARTRRESELTDPLYRRYAVVPVTARHNIKNQLLCNVSGEYLWGTYELASMVSAGATTGEIDLDFPDGGDAPAAQGEVRKEGMEGLDPIIWNIVDVTKAQQIGSDQNRHQLTKSTYSFNKAEDYTIAQGHKIGIVICRFWDISREDAMYVGPEAEWIQKRQELFGDKGKPCVYTGKIVRVSEDGKTFEHDINTFKGCAGAIIFLLDKNQPDVLATKTAQGGSLFGSAIGVHVGAPPDEIEGSDVNIGFTLP